MRDECFTTKTTFFVIKLITFAQINSLSVNSCLSTRVIARGVDGENNYLVNCAGKMRRCQWLCHKVAEFMSARWLIAVNISLWELWHFDCWHKTLLVKYWRLLVLSVSFSMLAYYEYVGYFITKNLKPTFNKASFLFVKFLSWLHESFLSSFDNLNPIRSR